jgi:hypothetical protein
MKFKYLIFVVGILNNIYIYYCFLFLLCTQINFNTLLSKLNYIKKCYINQIIILFNEL